MAFNPAELKKYGDQITSWLTHHAGVKKEGLDTNRDGKVDVLESLGYVFKTTDFKTLNTLLPALDGTPFKHPLDTRFFPAKINARIATIKAHVDGALHLLGIEPGQPKYCDLFVKGFFDAAQPQYDDGGLCLGYPKDIVTRYPNGDWTKEPELTAKESFDGCLDKALPYGSCTEATYKTISAIEKATNGACHVDAVETENHMYARYRGSSVFSGMDMDPAGLKSLGWEAVVNPVAKYYSSLTHFTDDLFPNKVAHALEPVMVPDVSPQYNEDGTFKNTLTLKDCLDMLDNWVPFVKAHPEALHPFVMMDKTIKSFAPATAGTLAMAYLERFPNNPYAGLPLLQLKHSEAETTRLANQIMAKYPTSGWGQLFMANFNFQNGRIAEAKKWLDRGEKAIPAGSSNVAFLNQRVDKLISEKKWNEALDLQLKIIARAPNFPGSHYHLARIYFGKGELDLAEKAINRDSIHGGAQAEVRMLAAEIAYKKGNPNRVLQEATILRKIGIASPLLEKMEIIALIQTGAYRRATTLIQSASETFPEALISMQCQLALDTLDMPMAIELAEKVSFDIDRQIYRLRIAYKKSDLPSLESELDRLKTRFPGAHSIIGYYNGVVRYMRGDLTGAATDFKTLADKDTYDYSAKMMEVVVALDMGDITKAERRWDELSRAFPDIYAIQMLKPLIEVRKNNPAQALLDFQMARSTDIADIHTTIATSAIVQLATHMPKGAMYQAKKLMEKLPTHPKGFIIAARAALELGDLKKAKEYMNKAKGLQRWDAKAWPLLSTTAIAADIAATKNKK